MALLLNGATMESYGLEQPASRFIGGAELVTMADGSVVQLGYPLALWDWGFISAAAYDALRVVCPGPSVSVTCTVKGDDMVTEMAYNAILIWPAGESIQRIAGRAIQFQLKLILLEAI